MLQICISSSNYNNFVLWENIEQWEEEKNIETHEHNSMRQEQLKIITNHLDISHLCIKFYDFIFLFFKDTHFTIHTHVYRVNFI